MNCNEAQKEVHRYVSEVCKYYSHQEEKVDTLRGKVADDQGPQSSKVTSIFV